jgi:hypothetical protein
MITFALLLAVQSPEPSSKPADDVVATLGARLATLRAAVDAAADDVARARQAETDDTAALERRRRDLQERLAGSALTLRELKARAESEGAVAAARSATDDDARAPVLQALTALGAHIDRVPFRSHSRRTRVDAAIRAASTATPTAAAALAWPIILDEARLLQERGRARQPIDVGGERLIAEVAHIGPLHFWKAKDGRVGMATLSDGPARFVEVTEMEGRQRLVLLFDALRRDALTGTFMVPNPITPATTTTTTGGAP